MTSNLVTSSGQNLKSYHFFNTTIIRRLWQLKMVIFLHDCLMRAVSFETERLTFFDAFLHFNKTIE